MGRTSSSLIALSLLHILWLQLTMGILNVPTGSGTSSTSTTSSSECPDSVIVLRRSSSTSWFGTASRPQHHPDLLRAPQSPIVTHSKKKGTKSWKNHPTQQNANLQSPHAFHHHQHRGHKPNQSIHLSSSQLIASSTPQHWLVFGGPSNRPTGGRTRTSLLFVVVAGGVAFLQLAYHVNYLVERYALEYSFRTATTATTSVSSSMARIGGGSLSSYDAPAINPTIVDASSASVNAESNLRNPQHLLEIKLTTTTTTTTSTSTGAATSALESAEIGGDAGEEPASRASPKSDVEKPPNVVPVTTTTTVTTRQLNVAAAASALSSALSSSATSMQANPAKATGNGGTSDESRKREPTSSTAQHPTDGKTRDEMMIMGAPPPALPVNSSSSRPYEVLLVVPGVGDAGRIPNLERSLLALQSSLTKGGYKFGCHVYVWNEDIVQEARDRLSPLQCDVHISEGMWTHHMSRVPSVSQTNYTHVGVLLDDVDVTGVELVDFLHLMDWSNFGVASPAFDDPIYASMHVRYNCFFHRTDFVNIFFAVFTSDVWACWQSRMIDTTNNPLGWGMDATLHHVCGATLGVIDAYEGVHRETQTSYSQTEARRQMYQFIASHAETDNPKRYLECAGQERPAAFEECQLYWDGTVARKSVDWQC